VVENELAKHDPIKHIAVQILEFSLSYETTPQKVKDLIKEGLKNDPVAQNLCEKYALKNGFENVDYLMEQMIYKKDSFNAMVIIDEIQDELETILLSRFKFPVEIITLQRYSTPEGEKIYQFEPFLSDITGLPLLTETMDPSEIDTIVVPAREDGFQTVFIGENRWYAVRIHGSMIPKIKHIACYRVAPTSAITHIAPVKSIEQWQDTNKYVLNFSQPAEEISPIKLVPKGKMKSPYSTRYTSIERVKSAKTLDDAFQKT
jgi:hypothetical protein